MGIEFSFFVQNASDLERALARVGNAPACTNGAFGVHAGRFSARLAKDIAIEVGFPVVGSLRMWLVNSRSVEATDGILSSTLAAARTLTGSSALYLALDARIFRRVDGVLECYPACGYWSMDRLEWLKADRPAFVLKSSDYPPEEHRALAVGEGDKHSFVVERLDGTEVIAVHSLTVKDRKLTVRYELRNTRMSDSEANVLIIVKVFGQLLQDSYRAQADRVEFHSATGGEATLPYL